MLLAPVVRERKGEYTQLFEQLQGQGFVRARVDGEIIDIDTPPELDKKKKHTIEVVVDRFKVRDDLGNRIAESFETALRLGGDIAVLSWMNGEHPERVFLQNTHVLNVTVPWLNLNHVCSHLTIHLVLALSVMV
jgi:excinuclease ABC subunit A